MGLQYKIRKGNEVIFDSEATNTTVADVVPAKSNSTDSVADKLANAMLAVRKRSQTSRPSEN
jgi:hypothetical protein